jgi:hypothetical protein
MPFEDLRNIAPWAIAHGHALTRTLLYEGQTLPKLSDFDWLVILAAAQDWRIPGGQNFTPLQPGRYRLPTYQERSVHCTPPMRSLPMALLAARYARNLRPAQSVIQKYDSRS